MNVPIGCMRSVGSAKPQHVVGRKGGGFDAKGSPGGGGGGESKKIGGESGGALLFRGHRTANS